METSFDRYTQLLKKNGVTSAYVSRKTGIPQPTFSDWKKGKSAPKLDKLAKIAQLFNVSVEYLAYGTLPEHVSTSGKVYYFDDATAQLAEEMYRNPELSMLMSGSRKLPPERLQALNTLVKGLLQGERKLDN